jgi:SAM-dependent methyltransferase
VRFFLYVTSNWNIWLAFVILYHDIRGGLKYHIETFAPVSLKRLTITGDDISKSSPYEAVNYFILESLLAAFNRRFAVRSIIDFGCGKGRVMVVAAHFGFRKITGIDFAKELCDEAIKNLKRTETLFGKLDWKVINDNVTRYEIQSSDQVFFLFNPFVEETLNAVLDKLEISCNAFPRPTWFLYASPLYAEVLKRRGYDEVFHKKFMNLEGKIFYKPG